MRTGAGARGQAALLLAACACGCLCVWALSLVFADLAMSRPRAALAAWEAGAPLGDYQSRRLLLARMGSAVAVNPLDAGQRLDLGRFFAWHAARHPPGTERERFYTRLAAQRFAEAITARPTWGFAWMLLAEQRDRLGRPEPEVLAAMARGAALAPHEPGVQLKHLWLGMGRWARLGQPGRDALETSLNGLLADSRYFRDAAGIAVHHGHEELVRRAIGAPWQRQAFGQMKRAVGG